MPSELEMIQTSLALDNRSAEISDCGVYRYTLKRRWSHGPQVLFVMLNPSKADALVDDNTIKKCVSFAKSWNYGALAVVNLFAFRATHPRDLLKCIDPIGPRNDQAILDLARESPLIVAAWGNHGAFHGRDQEVRRMLRDHEIHHLGLTQKGQPTHPLYLPVDTRLRMLTPLSSS